MSDLKVFTGGAYDTVQTDEKRLVKKLRIEYSSHRGVGPENTIRGLCETKRRGFDYMECDVRFTSDNVPVCIHNASGGGVVIADSTAEVVTNTVLDRDIGYGLIKIPDFDLFVRTARLIGIKLVVDAHQQWTEEQYRKIGMIVNKYGMQERVVYLCNSASIMRLFGEMSPGCHVHFCTTAGDSIPADISAFLQLKADGIKAGFNVNGTANADRVESHVRANGLELSYWNLASTNFSALAATYPMFMTTDMSMSEIKTAEKTFLDSLELW